MEMTGRYTKGYHKNHNDPSFYVKERKGTVFLPFLSYSFRMFIIKTPKDEIKE